MTYISKKLRQQVYDKFGGLCAYTGKTLGDNWQVDHMVSRYRHECALPIDIGTVDELIDYRQQCNHIDNLMPALYIVNHYKRSLDLEGFRRYMIRFHERLAKLPKKTLVPETERRIRYMKTVANAFDITVDNPFSGTFYFETL